MLIEKVKEAVRKYGMVNRGDLVLVAVSGGPDSVCLLSVLRDLADELGISLRVAHLDHMFRGKESAAEAEFAAGLAEKFGIPATIERFDVPAYCRERGLSPQAGAREARYAFLNRVADAAGAQKIALGHTASDQAETLLMRLVRGAGASGLSGIPPVRGTIIRPLIEATREEVLAHLREKRLEFVTDSSNLKPLYARNRVRLELMPVLARFNPRIAETLAAEAAILRDEDEALDAHLSALLPGVMSREEETVRINRQAFNAFLPALRRRIVRKAVEAAGAAPESLSSVRIEEALRFAVSARTGRAMRLPHGLVIEREYDALIVRPRSEQGPFSVRLAVPGVTEVPDLTLNVETQVLAVSSEENPPASPFSKGRTTGFPPLAKGGKEGFENIRSEENSLWQAVFDYDKISLPLYLRNRRPGDRFHPAGMGGRSKKLQDFLTDEKVPRRMRNALPIVATERDIVWVVGMRADGRFVPDEGTKRVLFVRIWGMK